MGSTFSRSRQYKVIQKQLSDKYDIQDYLVDRSKYQSRKVIGLIKESNPLVHIDTLQNKFYIQVGHSYDLISGFRVITAEKIRSIGAYIGVQKVAEAEKSGYCWRFSDMGIDVIGGLPKSPLIPSILIDHVIFVIEYEGEMPVDLQYELETLNMATDLIEEMRRRTVYTEYGTYTKGRFRKNTLL